jgi:hypothetical protein
MTVADPLPEESGAPGAMTGARGPESSARRLRRLYFVRVLISLLWVSTIYWLSSSQASGLLVALTLAAYPTIDAIAGMVDNRINPSPLLKWMLRGNLVAGLVAALAILSVSSDLSSEIRVFGLWAVISGAIQLALGISRQWSLKGQWLIIVSGAGSIVGGLAFLGLSGLTSSGLQALSQYSIGGAVFYLLTAGWLLVSARLLSTLGLGPS